MTKKTGTQGADELENGIPQLDDVEMLDPHSLHEAVRVVQHVIADRIPHVVEITEQEVLIVGKAVNDVVDAARAQVVESREILAQVDENSGIAVTIERLATAMEKFLNTLNPYLKRQEVVSSTAANYGAKIEEAGHKIETIALAANILNLNAQIEAARERRRQSRINEDGEGDAASALRATELPSNHPFATSEAVDGALSAKQAAKIREMNKPRVPRGRGAGGRKDR